MFNSFPNDKILDFKVKLIAFADDKVKVTQKLKFVLEKIENIVGKEENADYHNFLHFQECFQKVSFSVSSKVGIVWLSCTLPAIVLTVWKEWDLHQ